jgi:hypothetical protein
MQGAVLVVTSVHGRKVAIFDALEEAGKRATRVESNSMDE